MAENKGQKPTTGMRRGPMGHGGPPMGRPVEKAKDFKGTVKRLMVYLRPRRSNLIVVFIFAILSTVFNIVGPKIMGKATTRLFEGLMAKGQYAKDVLFSPKNIPSLLKMPDLPESIRKSINAAMANPKAAQAAPPKMDVNNLDPSVWKFISVHGPRVDFNYIGRIILLLIGLYVVSVIFAYIQQYIMAGVAQKTVFDMRNDINDKLNKLP